MRKLSLGILALAACGRFGFEPGETGAPDATQPDDGAVGDLHALSCGQPTRFVLGAVNPLAALAASPTAEGFVVAGVDAAHQLIGWSYAWRGEALEATSQRVPLDGDAFTVGAAPAGGDALVAAVVATGTTLYPVGDAFAKRGPAVERVEIAGDAPVAGSGVDGELALVTVDAATARVDVARVDALGAVESASRMIVDPVEQASSVSLATAGTGYLAVWVSRAATPNTSRLALLDPSFGVVAGPVTANTTAFDATRAQAVWSAGANRYLIAWYEKNAAGGDDIWYQLRGANLEPITPAVILARDAYNPMLASDGTAFWVAYVDVTAQPEKLAAARIGTDGQVVARAVPNSGGKPAGWNLVTRTDQTVLVWQETGGTGPDLYFDPLCD